jgi:hypothetical protein
MHAVYFKTSRARIRDSRTRALGIDITAEDPGAFACECQGTATADSRPCAGDERHFASQTISHCTCLGLLSVSDVTGSTAMPGIGVCDSADQQNRFLRPGVQS